VKALNICRNILNSSEFGKKTREKCHTVSTGSTCKASIFDSIHFSENDAKSQAILIKSQDSYESIDLTLDIKNSSPKKN